MEHFIYIADPMCSWCYGFGPQLTRFMEKFPDAQLDIMLGGLRAHAKEPISDGLRQEIHQHWQRVEIQSGLPFVALGKSPLDQPGFVYDTEPACRAVVCIRYAQLQDPVEIGNAASHPQFAIEYFHALQIAWYRDGRDITQANTLREIASEQGLHAESFLRMWQSEEMRQATEQDFMLTQKIGVRGFPTLIGLHNGEMQLITSGFHNAEQMWEIVAEIIAN